MEKKMILTKKIWFLKFHKGFRIIYNQMILINRSLLQKKKDRKYGMYFHIK